MKNKKLLILLCVPLIIAVMVLPLCSFTTVINSPGDHFESKSRVDLEYVYQRSDKFYFGNIFNFLSCSMTYGTLSTARDSIKFTACNYVMDSGNELEYKSFASNRNPSILRSVGEDPSYYGTYQANIDLSIETDNSLETVFTSVAFKDYRGDDYTIEIFGGNYAPITDNYFGIGFYSLGRLYYRESEENDWEYITYNVVLSPSDLNIKDGKIHVLDLYYYILEYNDIDERYEVVFPYLEFDILLYETAETEDHNALRGFNLLGHIGGVRVGGDIYHYSSYTYPHNAYAESHYYNLGYDTGYDLGYTQGLNYGRSTASEVWGSLGEFLDSTVGDFMEAELFPGFTIEIVLGIFVGAVLLVSFLKLFAGG